MYVYTQFLAKLRVKRLNHFLNYESNRVRYSVIHSEDISTNRKCGNFQFAMDAILARERAQLHRLSPPESVENKLHGPIERRSRGSYPQILRYSLRSEEHTSELQSQFHLVC